MQSRIRIKWAVYYWLGTIMQIGLATFIIAILNQNKVQYGNGISLFVLILGGISSALWGIIISKKSGRVDSYKKILIDFFAVKQPIKYYNLCIIFLIIIFGVSLFSGKIIDGIKWYSFIFFWAQAIIFGGIEEIGWRYTFQHILENKVPFEIASIITFCAWGMWHYMYFYIVGSLQGINDISFLIGLLGSCFVLGAIFRVSNSLWLCVMYHALLNMFSQSLVANTLKLTVITTIINIVLSIVIVRYKEKTLL